MRILLRYERVLRLDRMHLSRHQRVHRRVAVGGVRDFADLELDVTVGRDEDLGRCGEEKNGN